MNPIISSVSPIDNICRDAKAEYVQYETIDESILEYLMNKVKQNSSKIEKLEQEFLRNQNELIEKKSYEIKLQQDLEHILRQYHAKFEEKNHWIARNIPGIRNI